MRKKVMAAVLTAAMVASVSAMPQMVAAADDEFKIGLITDVGGVNDGSFNQSAWEGLEKAGEELGVEVNYLESATDADYQPNMETFVDEDYDLIISVGYMLADATREAAEANPDTKFAIIDDSSIDLPNVTSLMFKAEQASYLVGYVAGLTTKTNNIGFVVGMTNETMNQFGYGYCAGAIDANPDITVQQFNANSFADSAQVRLWQTQRSPTALISYSRQLVLQDLVLSRPARKLVYMRSVLTLTSPASLRRPFLPLL